MNLHRRTPYGPLRADVAPALLPSLSAIVLALAWTLAAPPARAADPAEPELTQLSLEDLLKIQVTSVSRKSQRLTDTAAAAFVLTADDIARSGATSIPDALRMVPGLDVARVGSTHWAVSARGFNGRFANKLLVLIDGRSVYAPLYAGVFWEAQDVMLEDLDRIEVIRGPGAALWGANAVNGVINIITRKARATQGTLVSATVGNVDQGTLAVRHGNRIGDDTWYRVWAKGVKVGDSTAADGSSGQDTSHAWQTGGRLDREWGDGSRLSLIGGVSSSASAEVVYQPILIAPYAMPLTVHQQNEAAQVLGHYEWTLGNGAQGSLQGYVDKTRLSSRMLSEERTTFDFDFQVRQTYGARHDVIWGVGYRHAEDELRADAFVSSIDPPSDRTNLLSLFVHDEIELVPARWRLLLGSKFEHNSFTGIEVQPNARLLFTPTATDTLWGAVSRAARTPSRAERDATVDLNVLPPGTPQNPSPLPVLAEAVPSRDFDSERLTAYELGWRTQLANAVSLDIAAFHNVYDRLRASRSLATTPGVANGIPYLNYQILTANTLAAHSSGFEVAADWHPADWWRLQAGYTGLVLKARRNGDPANDGGAAALEGSTPRHQFTLRSSMNLTPAWQLDGWLRRVDRLDYASIPAYTALDLRLGWRLSRQFDLSLVGQNLTDAAHPEFVSDLLPSKALEVGRAYYIKARWQF